MSTSLAGKVLVLLRTSSTARLKPYKALKALGVTLVMVHPILHPAFADIFDVWVQCETTDVDAVEVALDAALAEHGLRADGIASFDEYGTYPAAQLAVRKGLRPLPFAPEHIRATNIKSDFRAFCTKVGLRSPKSYAFQDGATNFIAMREEHDMHFPLVLKPSPGAGSLLAKMVLNNDQLVEHGSLMWERLGSFADAKHFAALGAKQQIIMEEYVGGQEVDVDCVVENGVVRFATISDNFETNPPYFVEVGGLMPSALSAPQQADIRSLLDIFVAAYGTQIHGVLHFEAKFDFERNAAYVIEVNCRMGSAETHTLVRNTYGVDLGECFARLALGQSIPPALLGTGVPTGHHASVNIYPHSSGTLKHAVLPSDDPSFVDGILAAAPGNLVAPPPKMFYMLCWMVASGATANDALANIARLTNNFVQDVEPDSPSSP